jgi:hypothetical protein
MKTIPTIAKTKAAKAYIPLTFIVFLSFIYSGLFIPGVFLNILNAFMGIASIAIIYSIKNRMIDLYTVRMLEKFSSNFKNISIGLREEFNGNKNTNDSL